MSLVEIKSLLLKGSELVIKTWLLKNNTVFFGFASYFVIKYLTNWYYVGTGGGGAF